MRKYYTEQLNQDTFWIRNEKDDIIGQVYVVWNSENRVYEVDGTLNDEKFSFDIDEYDADLYIDNTDPDETFINDELFFKKLENDV